MNESKSTLSYLVSQPVSEYWSWWIEQLLSAVPAPLKRILFNSNKLVLEIEESFFEIHRIVGNKRNQVARLSIDDINSGQIHSIVREANVTEKILAIPRSHVLEKNVSFPMAAEENIREVLSYEMDRLTPFTANQVYYDYYLIARNKKKNTVDLKLIVVPKERIDNLLNSLDQIGFRPHVVTLRGEEADKYSPVNLLPVDKRANKINPLKIVNYTLAGVMAILLIVALLLPIWNKIKLIDSLEPDLNEYRKNAENITKLQKQVDKAEEEALFLVEKKQASILTLHVIDEMTQIIPDDTWVNQLDVNDNEVHIYGESISSASLLPTIEASKIFSNAQFRSPVTQNRQNNTERFHLSAQIKQEEI